MGVLSWIVVGAIAGWLAGLVVQGTGFGLLGDIIVGVVGGLLGGFLGQETQVLAVCDVDTTRRSAAQKRVDDFYGKRAGQRAGCAAYSDFRGMPWYQMFRTERLHLAFLKGYRVVFFGVLPALGIVNTAGGWLILRQVRSEQGRG